MPFSRLVLLLFALFTVPFPVRAFGESGHRIIAELAARQLRPAARAEVARLLQGEPEPSLAGVANWADAVRAAESGSKRTNRWHFVNFKGGDCTYLPPRDCPDGNCVIDAINRNFLALADHARPDAERRDALKYLVHFVGDVHQPLHATPRDDHGGGEFQISYQGQGSNLHAVWDALLLRTAGYSNQEYVDRLSALPPLAADSTRHSDRPAVDWAIESCQIVQHGNIYPATHLIDDRYLDAHRPVIEQRLRRAGSRLADMLNFALDPNVPRTNR